MDDVCSLVAYMYMKARPNHRIWQRPAVSGALGNLTKNKNLAFLTHYFLGGSRTFINKNKSVGLGRVHPRSESAPLSHKNGRGNAGIVLS